MYDSALIPAQRSQKPKFYDMKDLILRQMLECWIDLDQAWSIPVEALGKGHKKRLPRAAWTALEETCAGADPDENREAREHPVTPGNRLLDHRAILRSRNDSEAAFERV